MVKLPFFIQSAPISPAFSGTPQEFATHLVERLRIVGPSGFYGVVVSDTEPTSNQGLWLKGGAKPYTWDDDLAEYVPMDLTDSLTALIALVGELSTKLNLGRVIFSDSEPAYSVGPPLVDNRTNVLWAKTASGAVLGLYAWNGLIWARVPGSPPNIVLAAGTGVTYTGTANDPDITALAGLVNRILIFVPHVDNSGASVFNYQSFGDVAFRKEGSKPLESGDLRTGMRVPVLYDGTYWQVLSPTYSSAPMPALTKKYVSTEIAIGTPGTVGTPLAHGLTERPLLVFGKLVCKVAEYGVAAEVELPLSDFTWHFVSGTNDAGGTAPIQLHADVTNITPVWSFNASGNDILLKPASSGSWVAITQANWKLKIVALA